MTARTLAGMRRMTLTMVPPDDAIVLVGAQLRCDRCGETWISPLGVFGDDPIDSTCPVCDAPPPEAA